MILLCHFFFSREMFARVISENDVATVDLYMRKEHDVSYDWDCDLSADSLAFFSDDIIMGI